MTSAQARAAGIVALSALMSCACPPHEAKQPADEPTAAEGEARVEDKPEEAMSTVPIKAEDLRMRRFPSAAEALAAVMASRPRVLGVGEYHQKHKTAAITSAVSRFSAHLLPKLAPLASDLIVETWVTTGKCGEQEKKVVDDVDKVTRRPEATENELITLLRRAKELEVQPHILEVGCREYQKILANEGVDYRGLLEMIGGHLRKQAGRVLAARGANRAKRKAAGKAAKKGSRPFPPKTVVLYGGALHNDLHPYAELATYSYAEALDRATDGGYVELDLYVPEFIEHDELLAREPWFELFKKNVSDREVLLIDRSPRSHILVFSRSTQTAKPPRE